MEFKYSPVNCESSRICFVQSSVPDFLRQKILNSIDSADEPANKLLLGAINNEKVLTSLFDIKDWHDYILLLCDKFNTHFPSWKNEVNLLITTIDNDGDFSLELDIPWVNRMKKHEYNPVHKHSGLYSYVLWVNVPYNMDDERKVFPDIGGNCKNGGFSFVDSHGQYDISIDKSWEWEIVLFPSKQLHCVYPFYTSDGERISIAGNVTM